MSDSPDSMPLGKYLASTEKKTRDKAIKNLASFLSDSTQDAMAPAEMSKLWKGIFYCFWMSDKPLVQQALASELAEILLTITNTSSAVTFLRGFWECIVREWSGIDRLRIDKYYMLVRRFVNATFRLLAKTKWDNGVCLECNSILTGPGGPLCPEDLKVPTSLSSHLSDIYLEELEKSLSLTATPSSRPAPLCTLISPFLHFASRTITNTSYKRVRSALLDPLLFALKPPASSSDDDDGPPRKKVKVAEEDYPEIIANSCGTNPKKEGRMARGALRKALVRQMFEVASSPESRDANRRRMYLICKEAGEDSDAESDEE